MGRRNKRRSNAGNAGVGMLDSRPILSRLYTAHTRLVYAISEGYRFLRAAGGAYSENCFRRKFVTMRSNRNVVAVKMSPQRSTFDGAYRWLNDAVVGGYGILFSCVGTYCQHLRLGQFRGTAAFAARLSSFANVGSPREPMRSDVFPPKSRLSVAILAKSYHPNPTTRLGNALDSIFDVLLNFCKHGGLHRGIWGPVSVLWHGRAAKPFPGARSIAH